LLWQSTEKSLLDHFTRFGDIEEVKIVIDKNTGRSKGYGFVTFRDFDSARAAVADGYPLIDGKQANCNLASQGQASVPAGGKKRQAPVPYVDPYLFQQQQQMQPPPKRRKYDPNEEQPQITLLKQREKKGVYLTKEEAVATIEQLREPDPCEAFKYFLEVSELLRHTPEYDPYYNTLLEGARRVRAQQAQADGQTEGLAATYAPVST